MGEDTTTVTETEADRRYRVLVLLNRTDKPVYMKFLCPRCGMAVSELINSEVKALSDTQDFDNTSLNAVAVRCDGRYDNGYCRIWYIFALGYGDDVK